ncbi:MAG: hypothetical protein KC713_03595, partial [Candidatus Omnitrophica bacterium]|nr:hypothetical protein [Candidatus Omnitrophota bacterium]
ASDIRSWYKHWRATPATICRLNCDHQSKHRKKYQNKKIVYQSKRSHRPYTYGNVVLTLPFGYVSINVGGKRYHYHDGHYYVRYGNRYKIVAPPMGACVSYLPWGTSEMKHRGKKYYRHNDIYYEHTRRGYVVVPTPYPVVYEVESAERRSNGIYQSPEPKHQVDVVNDAVFIINIPDEKGGYTPIKLTRKNSGFVGPQGEYYDSFPRVEDLKVIYGES